MAKPRVLLTGATGYLGAFLIRELVHGTGAQVHCLVRARDEEHARERIRAMMTEMRIWDDAYSARITPVIGDLAQPRLGLSDQAYAALSETIDVIYHSGALVNFIYPYEHLKGANVEGTAEILRLAATTRTIDMHIARLREKLGEDPDTARIVVTVRSKGYMLGDSVEIAAP